MQQARSRTIRRSDPIAAPAAALVAASSARARPKSRAPDQHEPAFKGSHSAKYQDKARLFSGADSVIRFQPSRHRVESDSAQHFDGFIRRALEIRHDCQRGIPVAINVFSDLTMNIGMQTIRAAPARQTVAAESFCHCGQLQNQGFSAVGEFASTCQTDQQSSRAQNHQEFQRAA